MAGCAHRLSLLHREMVEEDVSGAGPACSCICLLHCCPAPLLFTIDMTKEESWIMHTP